jgi:hypothetical protein
VINALVPKAIRQRRGLKAPSKLDMKLDHRSVKPVKDQTRWTLGPSLASPAGSLGVWLELYAGDA